MKKYFVMVSMMTLVVFLLNARVCAQQPSSSASTNLDFRGFAIMLNRIDRFLCGGVTIMSEVWNLEPDEAKPDWRTVGTGWEKRYRVSKYAAKLRGSLVVMKLFLDGRYQLEVDDGSPVLKMLREGSWLHEFAK